MVDLEFKIESVEVEKYSAAPLLQFALHVVNKSAAVSIKNILLSCQIRIEPARRGYGADERERLVELFGAGEHRAPRCEACFQQRQCRDPRVHPRKPRATATAMHA